MTIGLLTFGAALGGSATLVSWAAIRGYRLHRELMLVACPDNGAPVVVKLHAVRAAATGLAGKPDLRVRSCSRWPEKRDCGQECLSQIKGAPGACSVRSILATSYRAARCAECGVDIGEVGRGEAKPVLMSPDRKTRIAWDEAPPQELPKILSTYSRICWNCHMEKSFRALRTNRQGGDPPRRGARRSLAS